MEGSKEIIEVVALYKEILILIIILFVVSIFYLLQLYMPEKKTKYANGQLLRFIKAMPLMGLFDVIRDWKNNNKNTSR